jgi:hypothetical protein
MSNFFLLKKGDSQNKCRNTLISLIACYLLGRAAFSTILAGKFGAFEGRYGYGNLGSSGEKSINVLNGVVIFLLKKYALKAELVFKHNIEIKFILLNKK